MPESGSEIKGHQRSYEELKTASGYRADKDFANLMTLLDRTLKLITPVAEVRGRGGSQSCGGRTRDQRSQSRQLYAHA